MSRTTLDEAIAAVFDDCVRHDRARPREEAPGTHSGPCCSRCGKPGHYAPTCTSPDVAPSRRGAGEAPRATPAELAHLDDVIALQHRALAQHRSAVQHWRAAGDEGRADAALWREDYVGALLVQLRIDRAALGGS